MKTYIALVFIGLVIGSYVWLISSHARYGIKLDLLSTKVEAYLAALSEVSKKLTEKNLDFEADDYSVRVMDDGRVKVTFHKINGDMPKLDEKEPAQFSSVDRVVILPAWVFSKLNAEAAIKLSFEAAKKSKEAKKESTE